MAGKIVVWLLLVILSLGSKSHALVVGGTGTGTGTGTGKMVPAAPPPAPTLTQDLEEVYRMIQLQPIKELAMRYMLNDAQFQTLIRIINSQEAFTARWRLNSHIELINFQRWVMQQLLASGGPLEMEEAESPISLFNTYSYWPATVRGVEGFLSEFELYCPRHAIIAHIESKKLQGGIFAQFWNKLNALLPVYDWWLNLPETQAVVTQLHAAGINATILDQNIREFFGWNVVENVTTSSTEVPMLVNNVPISGADTLGTTTI